jgi:hypothetical protein
MFYTALLTNEKNRTNYEKGKTTSNSTLTLAVDGRKVEEPH